MINSFEIKVDILSKRWNSQNGLIQNVYKNIYIYFYYVSCLICIRLTKCLFINFGFGFVYFRLLIKCLLMKLMCLIFKI